MIALRFKPVDTWFFKEARPMDSFGGTELESLFPPPARTLLGALRTKIGDDNHTDWQYFPRNYPELASIIGDADNYGTLQSRGVFLEYNGETLYPLPKHIVHIDFKKFRQIPIGDSIETDLGKVRLPTLPLSKDQQRYEVPDENLWITSKDLLSILEGDTPSKVFQEKDLVSCESRVGIARDNTTRTVKEGMLYMTRHIRLVPNLYVLMELDGLPEKYRTAGLCKLGGEGRGAYMEFDEMRKIPLPAQPNRAIEGVFCTLLTPGRVDPRQPLKEHNTSSAVVLKSFREGGFDISRKSSREAKSYIPAGSVWFYEMTGEEAQKFIEKFHETQIGEEQELGRGRIACGYWIKNNEIKGE